MELETISERWWKGSQSWRYERVERVTLPAGPGRLSEVHKLRVSITRDAYDFQSSARLHRWDGTAWQCVVSRPISLCSCRVVSHVIPCLDARLEGFFQSDADAMRAEALEVLR